jgi:hypothetical protein
MLWIKSEIDPVYFRHYTSFELISKTLISSDTLQACSNTTIASTILIADGACNGARSCMSISGYSAISNSSCQGPKSCQNMYDSKSNSHVLCSL